MATNTDGQGDRTDERQSDLAVMDAQEYKQKRRLERILDALDNVQDTADEAWAEYVQGQISREARNITVQRTVTNAIRECYKLLLDHSRTADNDRYWIGDDDNPLGRVTVPVADGGLSDDEGEIVGLRDFHEAPTFFEATVTDTERPRNMPPRTVEVTMPEKISYRAYLRLKEFLDDIHDMEITFEEMDDDELPMIRGFDQSDPDEHGDGQAESDDVEYHGPPDI